MSEHHSHRKSDTRRPALLVGVLIVVAVFGFAHLENGGAFMSPEVKFTDSSHNGLAIVPASCPSDPSTNSCDETTSPPGGGGGGGGGGPPDGSCWIWAESGSAPGVEKQSAVAGESIVLKWTTANFQWTLTSVSPSNGFITPSIASVDPTGSILISPSQTTTYTLTGSYRVFGVVVGSYSCYHTVYVLSCPPDYTPQNGQCVLTSCPAGYALQNGQCVFVAGSTCTPQLICSGNYSVYQAANCTLSQYQLCASPNVCSPGAGCTVPVPSIVTWSVHPVLVQRGSTVQVSWQAQNVASCTITGTNGDSWTGLSGTQTSSAIMGQTIYTITCQGHPGASPASVSESTTVNIIPIFQEK